MSIQEQRREKFEQAVIDRMNESGFLEVEIRVECLARSGEGYSDGSIDAYWHFWNAALDGVEIELGHSDSAPSAEYRQGYDEALDDARESIEAAGLKVKS